MRHPVAEPRFPQGGAPTLQVVPTHNFAQFSHKLHEIERIWTPSPSSRSAKAAL